MDDNMIAKSKDWKKLTAYNEGYLIGYKDGKKDMLKEIIERAKIINVMDAGNYEFKARLRNELTQLSK
jgi:hypothetical protein